MNMKDVGEKLLQGLEKHREERDAREELRQRCPYEVNFPNQKSDAVVAMADQWPLASDGHGLIVCSEVVVDEEHLQNLIGDRDTVDVEIRAVDREQEDAAAISDYLKRFG